MIGIRNYYAVVFRIAGVTIAVMTRSGMYMFRVKNLVRRISPVVSVLVVLVASMCSACLPEPIPVVEVTPTLETFSQWAVAAESSSQFGFPDWGVTRATGAAEITTCKDDSRAWASARGNGVEWIRLAYAMPVYATEVRIYQNLGRGSISRVSLIDADGNVNEVWLGTDVTDPCPGVLIVTVPQTAYRVVGVLIDLDESRTGFWNQIDAVELIGVR